MFRIPNRALFALLIAFIALPLLADNDANTDDDARFELKYAKDFTFHGGRVSIDHAFGSLTVRTSPGSAVQVRATIRSSNEDIGKQIHIVAAENAGGVTIRTELPEIRNWRGRLSYSVDMTVTLPANAPVTAKNRFGNIDARGLQAASVIENRQGSVVVENLRGPQSISNAFGSIEATEIRGELTINNNNGSVTVRKVDGPLNIANRFGSIEVADVQHAAIISNTNGSIEAMDITGALKATNAFGNVKASTIGGGADVTTTNARVDLSNIGAGATVRNAFGSIDVKNVTGAATLTNTNGNVKVSDVGGALTVETRFGSVRADRVRGPATVDSSNGSVTLGDVSGNVKVHASFGSVFVDGVSGAVDVANSNGAISVANLRGTGCHPVLLRTNFSSIKVGIPDSASYAISARTTFGRINTEIPITTTNVGEDTVVGTIGKGGCRMDLANANGSITIAKE
jgi:hypothetical protein